MSIMNKSWKQFNIDCLRFDYGLYAELFADEHDDRRLLANTYNQIIEALESLPEEPVAFICVAVNKEIEKDRQEMRKVLDKYLNGLWGEPVRFGILDKYKRWPDMRF